MKHLSNTITKSFSLIPTDARKLHDTLECLESRIAPAVVLGVFDLDADGTVDDIRITGDADTGRLLGAQLIGPKGTETAKRVDTYATALFHNMTVDGMSELDLSYTPPLGSPWDAVQMAAQAWVRDHQLPAQRGALRPAGVS